MTFSIQRSAFNVQRSACDISHHAARSTQHAVPVTQHAERSTHDGFTLIEMMVVIVVISLTAMIVLPLLPSTDAANLRSSARSLAAVVRYLGDRSVTTKSPYRMMLNLTDNTITVKKIVNGEETPPEDPFFARRILTDGIQIEDVGIPRLGKIGEGTVAIDFGGAGLGDMVIIHLKGSKDLHATVSALPGGGKGRGA